MPSKKVNFGAKPQAKPPSVDDWVETRVTPEADEPVEPQEEPEKMKRLTLDIPESLHRTIKSRAVVEGTTMADMLRELLEETYR